MHLKASCLWWLIPPPPDLNTFLFLLRDATLPTLALLPASPLRLWPPLVLFRRLGPDPTIYHDTPVNLFTIDRMIDRPRQETCPKYINPVVSRFTASRDTPPLGSPLWRVRDFPAQWLLVAPPRPSPRGPCPSYSSNHTMENHIRWRSRPTKEKSRIGDASRRPAAAPASSSSTAAHAATHLVLCLTLPRLPAQWPCAARPPAALPLSNSDRSRRLDASTATRREAF